MNRAELVADIAQRTGNKKSEVERIIRSFEGSVCDALKRGEAVRMVGFGTLMVSERAARKGRNPRTGEEIEISASRRPVFKAGRKLLNKING